MDEPGIKVTGRTAKYVARIIDQNKYVFEIIDLHAGDDYKVIEITCVRMQAVWESAIAVPSRERQ